jgi:resuscitation-promoting factor RpfA
MTENAREEEIRRRYRELAREEPPRALDDAILAAARRELETRPAPLVAPTGRRRWTVPIAAAAVIVLSAVLTLHVQREQPDAELSAPLPATPGARKDGTAAVTSRGEVPREQPPALASKADAEAGGERREEMAKLQAPERRRAAEPSATKPSAPSIATAPVAVQPPPPPQPAPDLGRAAQSKPPADAGRFTPDPAPSTAPPAQVPQMQMRSAAPAAKPSPRASESGSAAGAGPPVAAEERPALGGVRDSARLREDSAALAKRAEPSESPERLLERIAALRREGRKKEADDLYAEFRKRFPEYRIPETMREQVLPR